MSQALEIEGKSKATETLGSDVQPRVIKVGDYTFEVSVQVLTEMVKKKKKKSWLVIQATELESKDVFAWKEPKKVVLKMNWPNKTLESIKVFIDAVLFNPDDGMQYEIGFMTPSKKSEEMNDDEEDNDDESDSEEETESDDEKELEFKSTYLANDIMVINIIFNNNKWMKGSWIFRLQPMEQDEIKRLQLIVTDLKKEIKRINRDVVPKGTVVMWNGSINEIPDCWQLCDGSNSTPDLRGRFILGGDGNYKYQIGGTGGSETHKHGVSVGYTTLTIDQIPSHNHTVYTQNREDGCSSGSSCTRSSMCETITSSNTGGGRPHNHPASCNNSSNMPPYFVLAYIIKIR